MSRRSSSLTTCYRFDGDEELEFPNRPDPNTNRHPGSSNRNAGPRTPADSRSAYNTRFMDTQAIVVRGAREHNLRDVNLELPRNKLIVFTGVSGSGKSSLAFDTIYAEGQR